MHPLFKEASENLDEVDCQKYCISLIKILAAFTQAIDEGLTIKDRDEVIKIAKSLLQDEDGIS